LNTILKKSWSYHPYPLGRFLIDFPSSTMIGNWYQVYCGTGRIEVIHDVTPEEFQSTIIKRTNELESVSHRKGGTLLIENIKLLVEHGVALIYWRNEFFKSDLLKVDDYAFIGGILYKFNGKTWLDPTRRKNYIDFVNEMFNSIRPLKPDEIPTEHGFCFDSSILVDEPREQINETVMASAVWMDHPDVQFSFTTITNNQTLDPPLLERLKKSRHPWGTKVLRSRRRDLASGDVGEEHLERIREGIGARRHVFVWEAQGQCGFKYEHPQIRLDMVTGCGREGPEKSSLSDEEALQLWDAIVDSIRLRPVTRAKE